MLTTDIACQRLINQRIAGERLTSPAEIVRWLGAVQAQDYYQCLWAVGARLPGATVAAVEQAIEDGSILRTWPMRGTIHFVTAEDAKWMLKLGAVRLLAADARRLAQLDLTYATIERCYDLIQAALAGGKRLTRADLLDVMEQQGIGTKNGRGYHIIWHSAQSGLICLGPMQNKEQTFVLLDEWVPHARTLTAEEGLAELVKRYFFSHAPATIQDFARWSGLTLTESRAGLAAVKHELIAEKIGRVEYWLPADAPAHSVDDCARAYLLAGFDEYFIGYQDRGALIAKEFEQRIIPGGNGVFKPMIVIGGQIVGTWQRTLKKKSVTITLSPFVPVGDLTERVGAAAEAYSAFVGLPLEIKSEG